MDTTDPDITFDEKGVCNHCYAAQAAANQHRVDKTQLPWIIHDIKKRGVGRKYDVVIGLSGGLDSSYALYTLVQHGVRVTAYHFDNGYNTKVADENVMKLVEGMKVPLFRYKIDRGKFKELYEAFIRGGIKNLEVVTDHILFATAYEMANRERVKIIASGGNWQTESIMPKHFGEDARDLYWIKSVYKQMTGKRLKGLPMIPLWKEQYYRLIKGIKFVPILDYIDYNREEAAARLNQLYGYQHPGGKHEESTLTKWFQNVYLPRRYGLDKRRPHYASMIHSGQLTREQALKLLESPPEEVHSPFDNWNTAERKSYHDYPNSEGIRKLVMRAYAYF